MYITLVLGKCPIVLVPTTKDGLADSKVHPWPGFVRDVYKSLHLEHDSFVSRYSTRQRVELYVWSIHLSKSSESDSKVLPASSI